MSREAVEEATIVLALAWNRLDPGLLEPWLADDVLYESPDTELLLDGRTQVMSYLVGKMELLAELGEDARVRAQIGTVALPGDPRHPCVISGQGDLERAALFIVRLGGDGRISTITVTTADPDPGSAEASGEFPS